MTSFAEIKHLQDHYPFQEDELEILLRGHLATEDASRDDSFLNQLAMSSPYSHFFLPGDEMQSRVNFMEAKVLPEGFGEHLKKALTSSDIFVVDCPSGNKEHKRLEQFLEGVASTGRRGPREAERVLYHLLDNPTPRDLVNLCFRLAVASHVLVAPDFSKELVEDRIQHESIATDALARSLMTACAEAHHQETTSDSTMDIKIVDELTGDVLDYWNRKGESVFTTWVEESVPLLPATLSTFCHNLLFHSHPYPASRTPYAYPFLDHASDIFINAQAPLLFALSCTSLQFGGKWNRLYSADMDGRSFDCLQYSLLGYSGPTLMMIQTQQDVILGAMATKPWKHSSTFYGDSDCFLFQLHPTLSVFRPDAKHENFMYCNPQPMGALAKHAGGSRAFGIGFGGTVEKPRLFLPTNLGNGCYARYLDDTYKNGHLLPVEAMEKFQIKFLEVWGVGGDEVIQQALRHRAEHRETMDTVLQKARTVVDKSQFATDMKSGLMMTDVFAHQKDVRGQDDFVVDDTHGGYKHEHKM